MTVLAPYGFTTGDGSGTDDCDDEEDAATAHDSASGRT